MNKNKKILISALVVGLIAVIAGVSFAAWAATTSGTATGNSAVVVGLSSGTLQGVQASSASATTNATGNERLYPYNQSTISEASMASAGVVYLMYEIEYTAENGKVVNLVVANDGSAITYANLRFKLYTDKAAACTAVYNSNKKVATTGVSAFASIAAVTSFTDTADGMTLATQTTGTGNTGVAYLVVALDSSTAADQGKAVKIKVAITQTA